MNLFGRKKSKVALVTGVAGFIGSNLADELLKRGWKVYGLDNLFIGKIENVNKKVKFTAGTICKKQWLEDYVGQVKPDVVFHLAALARIQPSIDDPVAANRVNLTGTLKLLEACRKNKVEKFVFAGSSAIYDDKQVPLFEEGPFCPKSPYALQKAQCEQYIDLYQNLYGLNYGIARFFNVYGPRQILEGAYAAVVGIFLNQVKKGEPISRTGDGHKRRDFTHVSDIVDGLIKLAEYEESGLIVNLGSGKNYSIKEIADAISPNQIDIGERVGEAEATLAHIGKAKKFLNWEPKWDIMTYIHNELGR